MTAPKEKKLDEAKQSKPPVFVGVVNNFGKDIVCVSDPLDPQSLKVTLKPGKNKLTSAQRSAIGKNQVVKVYFCDGFLKDVGVLRGDSLGEFTEVK